MEQAMHSASLSIWMNMLESTEITRNPTGHSCMKTCLRVLTYRKTRFMYLMEVRRKTAKAMKRLWKMSAWMYRFWELAETDISDLMSRVHRLQRKRTSLS